MADNNSNNLDPTLRWIQRGISLRKKKQWTESIECFDHAIEIDPKNPQAWSLKARVLDEIDNLTDAIKCYKIALEINPNSVGYFFTKKLILKFLKGFNVE